VVLPRDRYLGDATVERPSDGDEFDVPGEAGFVEVLADGRPRLDGERLRAALVVVQRDVEEPAGEPREAVAEPTACERLV
jgi:hypothetical protein